MKGSGKKRSSKGFRQKSKGFGGRISELAGEINGFRGMIYVIWIVSDSHSFSSAGEC